MSDGTAAARREEGVEPAEIVPAYPWLRSPVRDDLSTTRGFVFQFPPFPCLAPTSDASVHAAVPAGMYLHVPFCPYRCSYCYYAIKATTQRPAIEAWLGTITREMQLASERPLVARHTFRTLFIGGGTPSVLEPEQLQRLVGAARQYFDLRALEEFSMEVEPSTATPALLQAASELGVNRVSIGVQSFSTELNQLNERKHSADAALEAIRLARAAGIGNINLDLICGLVGETAESWEHTIRTLLEVAPEHVTIYLFSLRPQTGSYAAVKSGRMPAPPPERVRIERYRYARRALLDAGYVQTTPNCFVREPRFEQVHQRNAWSSEPLIGFGNSAYSYLDAWVTQNTRSMTKWEEMVAGGTIPIELGHRLDAREQMVRYAVLRVKQLRIDRLDFLRRFGFDVHEVFGPELGHLSLLGLLTVSPAAVALTEDGILYADDVCRALYTERVRRLLHQNEAAGRLVPSLI